MISNKNEVLVLMNYRFCIFNTVFIQIFVCLLDNAIKYSKYNESPVLKISIKENKNQRKFAIQNDGIGISEEILSKYF